MKEPAFMVAVWPLPSDLMVILNVPDGEAFVDSIPQSKPSDSSDVEIVPCVETRPLVLRGRLMLLY